MACSIEAIKALLLWASDWQCKGSNTGLDFCGQAIKCEV